MSKKLAEGIDGLVLDVKTGNGSFMERLEDSRALATAMCAIGKGLSKEIVALITRMDEPLGFAAGNSVEVAESVACLRGEGPKDLVDLSVEMAAEMVCLGRKAQSMDDARAICRRTIADGSALARFRRVVEAQGGDPRVVDDPSRLPAPRRKVVLRAPRSGFVSSLAARPVGHATMLLGAGRARMDSAIDHAVGVVLHKKTGDRVELDEPLCTLFVNDESQLEQASRMILEAYSIAELPAAALPLIVERVAAGKPVMTVPQSTV
jgi:thymidine phosphorylase